MARRASEFLSDRERDNLLDRYDRNQARLRDYQAGKGGFDDVGSATADRQAQALQDSYDHSGHGGHDWYDQLRRERDADRGGLGTPSGDSPDFTAPTDYSGAKDYSSPGGQKSQNVADSLRNSEQAGGQGGTGRDIGSQERAGWNNKTGSELGQAVAGNSPNDGVLVGYTGRKGRKMQGEHVVRGRISRRGLTGWAIGLAMGASMFGLTTLLSGPAQWIQVANFVKDVTMWVNGAQTGVRYLHNMRTLAKWEGVVSNSIQNSRLGIVSNRLANTAIDRMKERGMTFDSRWNGNAPSITIDTTKEYGNLFNQDAKGGKVSDKIHAKRVETLASKYGVEPSKLKLSSNGTVTIDFDGMSYTEARRFVSATNGVGKYNLIGQIQTRLALKKVGKISWLHPINKLKNKVSNKFIDWVKDRMDKIAKNGFGSADEAAAKAAEKAEAAGKSEDEIKKAAETARKGWTQAVKDAAEEITDKIIKLTVQKVGGKVSAAAIKSAIPIVGWVAAAIQAYCMVVALDDGIGAEKYEKVVTVAEGDTAETLAIGSQVQTGHSQDEDIDLDQLANATQLKLYNPDIAETSPTSSDDRATNEGYKVVGTTSSSWWRSAPVQAALGQQPSTTALNNVPAALNDVTNKGLSFGGNKDLQNIWNIFSNTLEFAAGGLVGVAMKAMNLPTPMDAVCWVFDQIDAVLGGILSWILEHTGLMSLIEQLPFMDALMNIMNNIMGWLRGAPLNIATATPEQYGSINMYGGTFTSNEQMLAVGGKVLSDGEQKSLALEQKQYLAEQQAKKPLLARLFDATDYNSTIAQIGRAADIDTSDQSIPTQLKNVGKIFASVPKLFAYALGKIGSNASAESPIGYNYNVPMIAFSSAEMTKMTKNPDYDMIPNTTAVQTMIDSGAITNEMAKRCWGVEVSGAPYYDITQIDNQSGGAWNYGDNYGGKDMSKSDCNSDETFRFRLFMLDSGIMIAADCYEGNGWSGGESAESCAKMGFELDSGGGSASGTCPDGSEVASDIKQGYWDGSYQDAVFCAVTGTTDSSLSGLRDSKVFSDNNDILQTNTTGKIVVLDEAATDLVSLVAKYKEDTGKDLAATFSYRSHNQQCIMYYYTHSLSKLPDACNDPNLARRADSMRKQMSGSYQMPGSFYTSQHESGKAIDIVDLAWIKKCGASNYDGKGNGRCWNYVSAAIPNDDNHIVWRNDK
ncbi:MAG: hypothetical protein ACM3JF_01635 [Sphaerimonospora mesophila]